MYVTVLYRATHLIVYPTVFSNGFSEGQLRDINRGFPSDSIPPLHRGMRGWKQGLDGVGDSQAPQIITPGNQLSCPSSFETTEVQNGDRFSLFLSVLPAWLTEITAPATAS